MKLFIFSGELSGDLHGSLLLKSLKNTGLAFEAFGVGGPALRAEGLACITNMEEFQVMGFTDVLASFPRLLKLFNKIRDAILEEQPDCVILIDYPGFNLRLAKSLRQKGYCGKIVQYICPTVWAHGKQRIQQMANTLDALLTIFPFEAAYFLHTDLRVEYVGNPLTEIINQYAYHHSWKANLKIPEGMPLIALFPGSRKNELQRNLPKQLQAAELLLKDDPELVFGISLVDDKFRPLLEELMQSTSPALQRRVFLVPKAYSYELMQGCRTAIAKSGTVTLELALHQKPAVVVYELTWLNRFIAKYLLRLNLPFYCIVNILKSKSIFPELIEKGFTKENLYAEVKELHKDTPKRAACLADCCSLKNELQHESTRLPSQQAAQVIVELLS